MAASTEYPVEAMRPMLMDHMKNSSSVQTLDIRQDAELQGKTKRHHIDLYWEFRKAGKKYQAIIDFKHLNQWLSEEVLLHSIDVQDDLLCKPKEILLSAMKKDVTFDQLAEKNDIILLDLTGIKWGNISSNSKIYYFNINIYRPQFSQVHFNQDEEWNRLELRRLEIPYDEASRIRIEFSDETKLYDENDKKVTTVFHLLNSLVPRGLEEMPPKKVTHSFKHPTFVETIDSRIRRVKINSVDVTISKIYENIKFKVDFADLVDHIIQTIIGGGINTLILDEMMKSNPTIKGYSSTLKDEIVRGKPSGRKAIRIYVSKKKSKDKLPENQIIPDTLNGIPVDVVEIGEPELLHGSTKPTEQIRPLVGGISIGSNGPNLCAGTLGYFVKDKEGHWYALSCRHVFGDVIDTPIIQPGSADAGRYPEDHVANLSKTIYNGFADAAIARLSIRAVPQMNELLSPTGIGSAEDNMKVAKSGRTTTITRGEITDTTAVFKMHGKIWRDQIVIRSNKLEPFADHGDSGSIVIDESTNQAIGLVFCGDNSIGTCCANHISDVLHFLGVELVCPGDEFQA